MITKKAFWFCVVLSVIVISLVGAVVETALPVISFDDGNKMTVYGDVVKASDGHSYRVTVTDTWTSTEPKMRVVDMYSLDGKYASITGISRVVNPSSWGKLSACSKEELTARRGCHRTSEAEVLLNEVTKRVMVKENLVGNFELFWSWSVGTKEIISKITQKK